MAFQQAQSEARYYEILGVAPGASLEEIKKAYHQRVMEYHPDKVSHLGQKLREVAEEEMKALNEAWAYFQRKFAEGGERREEKTIIHCPKCLQKLSVPVGKRIRVTCPACKMQFELTPESAEEAEPASPKQEPLQTFINSIGMEFVLIPAGSFLMGSPDGVGSGDEHPQHQVTISRPFYLGKYPVTEAQCKIVVGSSWSLFEEHPTCPVRNVSWSNAQYFINRLNKREGHSRYRLPTEAEWEYACRAGTTTTYFFGDDASQLERFAWYRGNTPYTEGKDGLNYLCPQPVGQKEANPWGLYDMCGNVREWVLDRYRGYFYNRSSPCDPTGPETGSQRVLRGGSFLCTSIVCRSADRDRSDRRSVDTGFRLALMVE